MGTHEISPSASQMKSVITWKKSMQDRFNMTATCYFSPNDIHSNPNQTPTCRVLDSTIGF